MSDMNDSGDTTDTAPMSTAEGKPYIAAAEALATQFGAAVVLVVLVDRDGEANTVVTVSPGIPRAPFLERLGPYLRELASRTDAAAKRLLLRAQTAN